MRVCDACFHNRGIPTGTNRFDSKQRIYRFDFIKSHVAELLDAALEEEGGTLIARKVGEAVQNTLGAVVGAIDIPLGEPQIQPALNKYLLVQINSGGILSCFQAW